MHLNGLDRSSKPPSALLREIPQIDQNGESASFAVLHDQITVWLVPLRPSDVPSELIRQSRDREPSFLLLGHLSLIDLNQDSIALSDLQEGLIALGDFETVRAAHQSRERLVLENDPNRVFFGRIASLDGLVHHIHLFELVLQQELELEDQPQFLLSGEIVSSKPFRQFQELAQLHGLVLPNQVVSQVFVVGSGLFIAPTRISIPIFFLPGRLLPIPLFLAISAFFLLPGRPLVPGAPSSPARRPPIAVLELRVLIPELQPGVVLEPPNLLRFPPMVVMVLEVDLGVVNELVLDVEVVKTSPLLALVVILVQRAQLGLLGDGVVLGVLHALLQHPVHRRARRNGPLVLDVVQDSLVSVLPQHGLFLEHIVLELHEAGVSGDALLHVLLIGLQKLLSLLQLDFFEFGLHELFELVQLLFLHLGVIVDLLVAPFTLFGVFDAFWGQSSGWLEVVVQGVEGGCRAVHCVLVARLLAF